MHSLAVFLKALIVLFFINENNVGAAIYGIDSWTDNRGRNIRQQNRYSGRSLVFSRPEKVPLIYEFHTQKTSNDEFEENSNGCGHLMIEVSNYSNRNKIICECKFGYDDQGLSCYDPFQSGFVAGGGGFAPPLNPNANDGVERDLM